DLVVDEETGLAPWQVDEGVWVKANPNLGVSKKIDDMRRLAKRSQEMPARLNAFLRLHLNIWTQAETRWINRRYWDLCGRARVEELQMQGRRCYGGLDISTNTDLSAWVLVFPPVAEGQAYEVLCRFWVPKDNVWDRVRRDKVPYDQWIREGWIEA